MDHFLVELTIKLKLLLLLYFLTAKLLERLVMGSRSTFFCSMVIKMYKKTNTKYSNFVSLIRNRNNQFKLTNSLIIVI